MIWELLTTVRPYEGFQFNEIFIQRLKQLVSKQILKMFSLKVWFKAKLGLRYKGVNFSESLSYLFLKNYSRQSINFLIIAYVRTEKEDSRLEKLPIISLKGTVLKTPKLFNFMFLNLLLHLNKRALPFVVSFQIQNELEEITKDRCQKRTKQ